MSQGTMKQESLMDVVGRDQLDEDTGTENTTSMTSELPKLEFDQEFNQELKERESRRVLRRIGKSIESRQLHEGMPVQMVNTSVAPDKSDASANYAEFHTQRKFGRDAVKTKQFELGQAVKCRLITWT